MTIFIAGDRLSIFQLVLTTKIRDVPVQQIVPFFGDALELDDDDEFIDRRNMLSSFRVGQFVVFQISDDKKWNTSANHNFSGA